MTEVYFVNWGILFFYKKNETLIIYYFIFIKRMSLSNVVEELENLNIESLSDTTTDENYPSIEEIHERAKKFTEKYPYGYPNSPNFQGRELFPN